MSGNNRTVVLMGSTGSGKSAAANALRGEQLFKESDSSISVTKAHQVEEFDVEDLHFKVVDTVGLGDTELSEQEVLFMLADACYSVKEGLHQVLFVTRGRFTVKEIEVYNLLRTVIFNNEVARFVTIVRTNFGRFENPDDCHQDIEKLRNGARSEILQSCNYRVVHIDNPEDDNKKREKSRRKLLTHLRNCRDVYRPRELHEIVESIKGYMEEKTRLEREVGQLQADIELRNQEIKDLATKMTESEKKGQEMIRNMIEQQKQQEARHQGDIAEMRKAKQEMEVAIERERVRIQEEIQRERERAQQEIARKEQETAMLRRQEELTRELIEEQKKAAAAEVRAAQAERDRAIMASQRNDDDDDGWCSVM